MIQFKMKFNFIEIKIQNVKLKFLSRIFERGKRDNILYYVHLHEYLNFME